MFTTEKLRWFCDALLSFCNLLDVPFSFSFYFAASQRSIQNVDEGAGKFPVTRTWAFLTSCSQMQQLTKQYYASVNLIHNNVTHIWIKDTEYCKKSVTTSTLSYIFCFFGFFYYWIGHREHPGKNRCLATIVTIYPRFKTVISALKVL